MRILNLNFFWLLIIGQLISKSTLAETSSAVINDPKRFLDVVIQNSTDPATAFREQLKLLRQNIEERKDALIKAAIKRDADGSKEPVRITEDDVTLTSDISFRLKLDIIETFLLNLNKIKGETKKAGKSSAAEISRLCDTTREDLEGLAGKDFEDGGARTAQKILELFCTQTR